MVDSEPLVVQEVHFHESANAKRHHTSAFDLVHMEPPTPVLRRGQPFNLRISFDRSYDDSRDIIRLVFNFGSKPTVMNGTRGVCTVTKRTDFPSELKHWSVRMISSKSKDLSVEIRAAPKSPVGVWRLTIQTTTVGRKKPVNNYAEEKDIYLLFNPWVKDDAVYMDDQKLLDEYVTNTTGKIWQGDRSGAEGRPWDFGQFDACVLPACQLMMKKSEIRDASRGDPIKMSRFISKIVNEADDGGVLEGKWFGDYSDGTSPSAWTGSVPILKEYLDTKNSVKYGQCWVFAGVVTTVCRALGIPSRVVTNINSAHDGDATLSIDQYWTSESNGFDFESDSIWNFHVWNDVWMSRPDLPRGYGGWQAIDATPQETSGGMYQCGPTSLEAIRRGDIGYNYDVAFMLAAVNADVMYWVEDEESESGWRKVECDKQDIGYMILTKAPFRFDPNGDGDREDITASYKDKEGTSKERLALRRAARDTVDGRRMYDIPDPSKEDIVFKLVDLDRVNLGEPFSLMVHIENKSTHPRNIYAVLSVKSVYYNGVNAQSVANKSVDLLVQPGEREKLELTVTADDYLDKLVEYSMMKLCAVATVKETRQIWADDDDFQILKVAIAIKTEAELEVGKRSTVVMTFTNPLKKVLTRCRVNYSGPGLKKNVTLPVKNINPDEKLFVEYEIVPQAAGEQHIVTTFTSVELADVIGSATVLVSEKKD